MQVNFQQELQKAKSQFSQEDIRFIVENYILENGFYIFYAWKLHQATPSIQKAVKALLQRGLGIYSSQSGHVIPTALINA